MQEDESENESDDEIEDKEETEEVDRLEIKKDDTIREDLAPLLSSVVLSGSPSQEAECTRQHQDHDQHGKPATQHPRDSEEMKVEEYVYKNKSVYEVSGPRT